MTDPRNGRISHDDLAIIEAFKAFLAVPTSRCPMCLSGEHTRFSQCPEVTDRERREIGVIRMDVNQARRLERIKVRAR